MTRVAETVTTGNTGNIATAYQNDGLTYIIAPLVSGTDAFLRTWIASTNGGWYFTAVNPNTGATLNNAQLAIRFLVVKIKSM